MTVAPITGVSTNVDDVCEQRLLKTLAALDAADLQIKARDSQITNLKEQIGLQNDRFREVLKILQEYAGLDNKQKKGFWKKVQGKLVGFIDTITEPATIKEILLVIALIKAGQ